MIDYRATPAQRAAWEQHKREVQERIERQNEKERAALAERARREALEETQ